MNQSLSEKADATERSAASKILEALTVPGCPPPCSDEETNSPSSPNSNEVSGFGLRFLMESKKRKEESSSDEASPTLHHQETKPVKKAKRELAEEVSTLLQAKPMGESTAAAAAAKPPPPAAAAAAAQTEISAEEGVTFPERLMELLNEEADKEALWWLPNGRAFAIQSRIFRDTILAEKFQGSKFESFTRKLARW
jgi:hypothetical protein